ncbi:MAG: WD40/YVTN/BNR-like repeat-containing protein [Dehalococcoidia bacterium]
MTEVRVYAGTRKGLIDFRSNDGRRTWSAPRLSLAGSDVYHAIEDPRDPKRVYAAANHAVWGARIVRSLDGGMTWDEPTQTPAFVEGSGESVKAVWFIRPGHADCPGEVWAGVEPASLFRSGDWGATWEPVNGLNEHPTRSMWQPGGGGMCMHGIILDPTNPDSLIAAASACGAYRSNDHGESWEPINRGIRAGFLPDQDVEAGHCVHRVVRSSANPNLLFQQNHCGAYISPDGGCSWREVTEGLPSEFGFSAAADQLDGRTFYTAPLQGDSFRAYPDGAMAVWRTRDAGCSWEPMREGLPQQGAYLASYRSAMATDAMQSTGVYVGTTTGQIFACGPDGDRWYQLADYLPPVLSLETAQDSA